MIRYANARILLKAVFGDPPGASTLFVKRALASKRLSAVIALLNFRDCPLDKFEKNRA
ncbi:protein of unknown function [Maridesulfovibrio hydrothermalis AM13 = DSM 14728]|uniref:Uncharacterized protein n=1 Tax=Maridesulfovibrio hydrothermalis AM13 = DSM 14728 TaxID=1121451 RepID=L0R747_9BACT|nr:protein of unknown function [Maridesulfovibrio hydrothermalis AM13 = DSM 14728]